MTHDTQFSKGHQDTICDLVIGLDFGTSCTKIVIRSPYHYDGRAYAVPFGKAAHRSSSYLLPSVLWVDEHGQCSLSRLKNGFVLRDVKHHVMSSKPIPPNNNRVDKRSFDPDVVAVVFLALALQRARGWFLNSQQELYGRFSLRWQLNLGLPSADFADTVLCDRYRRIASAAWYLSVSGTPIGLDAGASALRDVADWEPSEAVEADVQVVPEVAAEVVGYARSHLRDEGLHMLVDIGAGTLDVCSFILHEKDGDDRYELLTADVQELGTMVLYRGRVACVRKYVTQHVNGLWDDCDPVSAIPDKVEKYLPPFVRLQKHLDKSDAEYRRRCSQALWKTLIGLRTRRDPKSRRWRDEFPVFVSGGASGMSFYRQLIDSVSERLKQLYPDCQGIRTLSLTKPESLQADVNDKGYHRLAVAWGLSYPETDIGDVTRPAEIPDVPPPPRSDWQDRFIGKDDV